MTDTPPIKDLTDPQVEALELLVAEPRDAEALGDALGIAKNSAKGRIEGARKKLGGTDTVPYEPSGPTEGVYRVREDVAAALDEYEPADGGKDDAPALPDLSDTPVADDEPDPAALSERERYIVRQLQQGVPFGDLVDDLDERPRIAAQYLRELRRDGWSVYLDDTADHVAIEGDHTLRSSEHKGTRTRKANQWWEATHNELVRQFKALDLVDVPRRAEPGNEDWVTHLTDLHAGDRVRGYEGDIVHETADLPALIDHVTERSVALSRKHGSEYDTAYPLWTGDFVTNSGIYEGQFEDLDAWLDEQVDILHDPLLRQIKTFADEFPAVHVVCQPGNHGDIRASGTSKQANADLLVYKSVRNTVAALQEEGLLTNVAFTIGRAGSVTPFRLRDGAIHGQLRHGQDRSPQADTSARKKEWLSTILDSMNAGDAFDIAWMGHHHVSGRLPWNGPPVFITGSPKPGGEYPRKLGEMTGPGAQNIAHCHGVSDDGVTGVFPIDTRHYDR